MYLVDTNILSAGSPTVRMPFGELVAWMDRASASLYLSAVTVAEVHDGIEKAQREGATRKAETLRGWWETVEHLYGDRILPFGIAAARIAGALSDRARFIGAEPGFPDIAIAATAELHGFTVLTRNIRDFRPLGVACLDLTTRCHRSRLTIGHRPAHNLKLRASRAGGPVVGSRTAVASDLFVDHYGKPA
ncbi:PIN domain-containing protein [Mangrovicella endophytica]|uniref:PIN domain-containing protein n=1 Tax=Mangrovicella endophytica TaxID=2066697 RepID=UPI000C9E0A19